MRLIYGSGDTTNIHNNPNINVTDYVGHNNEERCKCGDLAYFKVVIYDKELYMCNYCISDLAKCIIDGLV